MATSIPKQIQALYTPLNFNVLPEKLTSMARDIFSFAPLPSESKVHALARRFFETLGALIFAVTSAMTLPFITLSHQLYELCRPGSYHRLFSTSGALTQEKMRSQLISIINNRFTCNTLEIVQERTLDPISLSINVQKLIQRLLPKQLILNNVNTPKEELMANLKTSNHYYNVQSTSAHSLYYQLALKKKIERVVLPSESSAMIEMLERLVIQKHRVKCLFFTAEIEEEDEDIVAELMEALAPDFKCLCLAENRDGPLGCDAIQMMLEA